MCMRHALLTSLLKHTASVMATRNLCCLSGILPPQPLQLLPPSLQQQQQQQQQQQRRRPSILALQANLT